MIRKAVIIPKVAQVRLTGATITRLTVTRPKVVDPLWIVPGTIRNANFFGSAAGFREGAVAKWLRQWIANPPPWVRLPPAPLFSSRESLCANFSVRNFSSQDFCAPRSFACVPLLATLLRKWLMHLRKWFSPLSKTDFAVRNLSTKLHRVHKSQCFRDPKVPPHDRSLRAKEAVCLRENLG